MSDRANKLSDRIAEVDDRSGGRVSDRVDVIADVLQALRFTTLFFGRFELGAPWALRVPAKPTSSFYVLARGQLRVAVEGLPAPVFLSAGDVVLLPHGASHVLDDGGRRAPAARDFIDGERLRDEASASASPRPLAAACVLGGPGPTSTLISGCFSLSPGETHPLLRALPRALPLRSGDPGAMPALAATVQLIAAESAAPGPGSSLVLGRLADVLLVHAFRAQMAREAADEGGGEPPTGLRALADPAVAAALALMHARWRDPWTVASLAEAVGLSRSGFSARFHALVGEPPLRYLAGWRMTKAARWLREGAEGIATIAERAGYESVPAFSKAFKQWRGVGPGEYRRSARPG
jgi:AraC-like DNA-binding protein